MDQETQQITQAIQTFLESIGAENLHAIKISFKQRSKEKIMTLGANCWEWDPIKQELVWVCG